MFGRLCGLGPITHPPEPFLGGQLTSGPEETQLAVDFHGLLGEGERRGGAASFGASLAGLFLGGFVWDGFLLMIFDV